MEASMKTRALPVTKGLLSLSLLVLFGVAALVPGARAGVGSVDKSSLDHKVHHEIVTLPWYGVFDNLEYKVNGSQVVLTGQVVSEHGQTKYDAANAVKRIPGVTEVVNNIQVLPPLPFDNQIRRAEYRAIFSQSSLGGYSMGTIPQIHIIVNGGHVTLEGTVMNQMDRNIAGLAANSVPNVFSVTNNLKVG
jgi:hyperosmotically inducible periplasmic protein